MGCSTGLSTRWLAAQFPAAQVTGLDLSPYFLAVAELERRRAVAGGPPAPSQQVGNRWGGFRVGGTCRGGSARRQDAGTSGPVAVVKPLWGALAGCDCGQGWSWICLVGFSDAYCLKRLASSSQPDCFETCLTCSLALRSGPRTTLVRLRLQACVWSHPFSFATAEALKGRIVALPDHVHLAHRWLAARVLVCAGGRAAAHGAAPQRLQHPLHARPGGEVALRVQLA